MKNFKSDSKPKVMENLKRSWKKLRKVVEFEELIREGTMILSGGQTGKNMSMICSVNCIRTFCALEESVQINKDLFLESQDYLAVQK